jgi:hypothetical protein
MPALVKMAGDVIVRPLGVDVTIGDPKLVNGGT